MAKHALFVFIFCFFWFIVPAFGQNNIKKNASIPYTLGPPTFTVNLASSSEIAVDSSTGKIYQYHRPTSSWLQIGQGIDVISGSIPPAYTPARNQSLFAINAVDSLYHYRSGAWRHLNAGGGGASVDGHVVMEGNTPRAHRDSLEFRSNSVIAFSATNNITRTIIEGTIQANGVGSAEIAADAVGSSEIAADAVSNSELAANAVDSTKIINGGVSVLDLGQHGASSGQALKWNGTQWAPADDEDNDAMDGSGAAGQVTTWQDGNTLTGENNLFWDAVNNRLGLNTATPDRTLSILSASGTNPSIQVASDGTIDQDVSLFEMVGTATGPYVQRARIELDVYSASGTIPDGHSMIFKLSRDGASTYTPLKLYPSQAIFDNASGFNIANNLGRLRFQALAAQGIYSTGINYLITNESNTTADTSTRLKVIGRTVTANTYSARFYDNASQIAMAVTDLRQVGIKTTSPTRDLHVAGEVRITDLTTDNPTRIVGADADGDLGALKIGNNLTISNDTLHATAGGASDHGALAGLSDDDHTQYALLAGRAGGQTLTGGTASGNNLSLSATAHATKGAVLIGADGSRTAVGASLYYRADLAPSALSANTDDWNPAGLDTAQTLRISATDTVELTGIQGGSDGRILYIHNIGEFSIILKDNTTSSSANRFEFDADIELRYGQGIILRYDATASKWRAAGSTTWARSAVSYLYTTPQTNTAVTVPAGAKIVSVFCIGGGGGGGSGRRGAAGSIRGGGSGGQAAFATESTFSLYDLGAPSTLYVNVGGGGSGGAAATSDDTDGANGSDGGDSDVRTTTSSGDRFIFASGGNNGSAGDNNGSSTGVFQDGGMFGGGNGGASSATGGNGTVSANNANITGGGGGGGVSSADAAGNGGSANTSCQSLYTSLTGGAGGSSGAAGSTRTLVTSRLFGQGGSGGGGGTAGTGGAGGNGIRGGGGGGGGASTNSNNSGAGGNGGDGLVRLIFYY